jgi:hypothetical protein
MVENILNGLLLGGLYPACGRKLAVPVIAHAFSDTLDILLIYLGKYPGMHQVCRVPHASICEACAACLPQASFTLMSCDLADADHQPVRYSRFKKSFAATTFVTRMFAPSY